HQQKGMISLSPPTICNSASERITMLQHAIYEQYEEYRADIPVSWSR
ncbi:hypothetical protein ABVB24_25315, partial [Escherichia coli]